jgi:S-DNA-T family DNA segregation ATPase FtsK/SpoIIIE
LVLLLDSWETIRDALDEVEHTELLVNLTGLLREASVQAFVSGDRSLLASRLSGAFRTRLVLALTDVSDYALAGIARREIPEELPPGRALLPSGGELQLAVVDREFRPEAIYHAIAEISQCWRGTVYDSFAVRRLPNHVSARELDPAGGRWRLPLGLGGDSLNTVELDLSETKAGLVAGGPGSGKTSALAAMARAAERQGLFVVIVGQEFGPSVAVAPGLPVAIDERQLRKLIEARGSALVVADDVELLRDTELDSALAGLIADRRHRVVLAGDAAELAAAFRGCIAEARRRRNGLLLAPGPGDGELFGQAKLTKLVSTGLGAPGRGILVQRGRAVTLQLANVDPYVDSDGPRAAQTSP